MKRVLLFVTALLILTQLAPLNAQVPPDIRRGTITDRNGNVLAETSADGNRVYNGGTAFASLLETGIEIGLNAYLETGMTVQLTVDQHLQEIAYQALTDEIATFNTNNATFPALGGVVIALDPRNGQVLALVEQGNSHVTTMYPPGKLWLPINSVALIEEEVIAPETELFDPGEITLPVNGTGQRMVCWLRHGHEVVDLREALAQSCDVYFYQTVGGNPEIAPSVLRADGLGAEGFYRWAAAFGQGSPVGIELPGEVAGIIPNPDWKLRSFGEAWHEGDTYNLGIGQGYLTTSPLHMAAAMMGIANGGSLYQPRLLYNLLDGAGSMVLPFSSQLTRSLVAEGVVPSLTLHEDMLIQHENSLACRCEPDSPTYDPNNCPLFGYSAQVQNMTYHVNVPGGYAFDDQVCDPNTFNGEPYLPPFADPATLAIVRQGMRQAITEGTAMMGDLPFVAVAGKTGTAEYCDTYAYEQGWCVPGAWRTHAWYAAFAPYDQPEIVVLAFIYNGSESIFAIPVVNKVLEAYFTGS